jgi:putative membrane protein
MIRLTLLLLCVSSEAFAHGGEHVAHEGFELLVYAPLICAVLIYAKGFAALRRGRYIASREALVRAGAFTTALVTLEIALTGPLHEAAEQSFAAHMIEHELLIVVGAPLFVLARPAGVMLHAFRKPVRQAIARGLARSRLTKLWRICSGLQAATLLHGAALWAWHVPALFDAALRIEALHWLQHATFLLTGVWFWRAVFAAVDRTRMALAIADLFATTMHMGLLGGLIALARNPLYMSASNMDAMSDQRLAGLIMWVPGCLIYAIVAFIIAARMLRPAMSIGDGPEPRPRLTP